MEGDLGDSGDPRDGWLLTWGAGERDTIPPPPTTDLLLRAVRFYGNLPQSVFSSPCQPRGRTLGRPDSGPAATGRLVCRKRCFVPRISAWVGAYLRSGRPLH